jgi:hypothetical protein
MPSDVPAQDVILGELDTGRGLLLLLLLMMRRRRRKGRRIDI